MVDYASKVSGGHIWNEINEMLLNRSEIFYLCCEVLCPIPCALHYTANLFKGNVCRHWCKCTVVGGIEST